MSKTQNTRVKNGVTQKRELVGYKTIPMQASHLPTPDGKVRCKLCWQLGAVTPTPGQKSKDHFCRWNIEVEGPGRDPNPKPRQQPIYRWVDVK